MTRAGVATGSGRAAAACLVLMAMAALAGPAVAVPADDSRIARGVEARYGNPALGADYTVHVRNVATDSSVAARSADERQLPASTMKVVTAATALASLGPGHRFTTRVVPGSDPGSIVLVGGGDPLLSLSKLKQLADRTARELKGSGVDGVVVDVDDYLFPRPSDAPGWTRGDRPTYASAVRPLGLFGEYSNDTVATAWGAFVQALQSAGIRARQGERVVAPSGADEWARVRSATLRKAVGVMLRVSENNVAEILFRQVALAQGYPATWSGSSSAAKEVLRGLGLPTWRLDLIDGSGLSQDDRLTARFLTGLLDIAATSPDLEALVDGLPVAGESGTLAYRFAGPPASCARGEVAAKTGSLTGVSTLAGLTRGEDGEWRSFAVMVNQRPAGYPAAATSLAIDTIAAAVQGCA